MSSPIPSRKTEFGRLLYWLKFEFVLSILAPYADGRLYLAGRGRDLEGQKAKSDQNLLRDPHALTDRAGGARAQAHGISPSNGHSGTAPYDDAREPFGRLGSVGHGGRQLYFCRNYPEYYETVKFSVFGPDFVLLSKHLTTLKAAHRRPPNGSRTS